MTAGGVVGLPEDPYDRNALGMPATLERQAHEGAGLTVLGDACFLDELSPQLPSLPNQAFNVLELSCPQFFQALTHGSRSGGIAGKFLQIDPRLLGGADLHVARHGDQHRD